MRTHRAQQTTRAASASSSATTTKPRPKKPRARAIAPRPEAHHGKRAAMSRHPPRVARPPRRMPAEAPFDDERRQRRRRAGAVPARERATASIAERLAVARLAIRVRLVGGAVEGGAPRYVRERARDQTRGSPTS